MGSKRKGNDEDSSQADEHDKKKRRRERKELEQKALSLLPKDQQNKSFSKQELRRMRKRIARGLPPLETEQEQNERRRREKQLQREEQDELAGLVDELNKREANMSEDMEPRDDKKTDGVDDETSKESQKDRGKDHNEPAHVQQITKKNMRAKPVPFDYVCFACNNRNEPRHWIYDCPDKITVKGCNQLSAKQKGLQNPDSRKVFVSGLSFDVNFKGIVEIFGSCGKILHCKLLTFEDSKRCKGQAILSFETDQAAKKALLLNGKDVGSEGKNDRKLTLSVSKALNRALTKKGNS